MTEETRLVNRLLWYTSDPTGWTLMKVTLKNEFAGNRNEKKSSVKNKRNWKNELIWMRGIDLSCPVFSLTFELFIFLLSTYYMNPILSCACSIRIQRVLSIRGHPKEMSSRSFFFFQLIPNCKIHKFSKSGKRGRQKSCAPLIYTCTFGNINKHKYIIQTWTPNSFWTDRNRIHLFFGLFCHE